MVRDFSPEEISYMATSFAAALANDMDDASLRVLCTFFVSVVGSLNLILAQRRLLKDGCAGCGKPPLAPPARGGDCRKC